MKLFLCFGVLFGVCATLFATQLTFPTTATVSSGQMRLTEIATIAGTAEERAQLQDVSFGAAPLKGQHHTLTRGMIRMRLRQYGLDPDSLVIDCPEQVTVSRLSTAVGGDTIAALAQQWCLEHTSLQENERMVITPLRMPADQQLPDGTLTWEYAETGTTNGATRCITVTALLDGKPAWRGIVTMKVQRFATVLVAKRAISRHQPVTADMLTLEERDLTGINATPCTDPAQAIGLRAVCSLAQGAMITAGNIEQAPLVKRNDIVQVKARCGAFIISTQAVVSEDGCMGAMIRVRNAQTRQEFIARVTGPGELEVVQ